MAQQNLTSNDTQVPWLVEVINVKWMHYMMHKPNHTPCTMKQIVEPPITCLSINIWSNDRSNIPQNDRTLHGHVSQWFLTIINVIPHVYCLWNLDLTFCCFIKIIFLSKLNKGLWMFIRHHTRKNAIWSLL
jgi:hypothetical protein